MTSVEVDTRTAGKLLLICRQLNHDVRGLDGRKENLLEKVRYGGGFFKEGFKKLEGGKRIIREE